MMFVHPIELTPKQILISDSIVGQGGCGSKGRMNEKSLHMCWRFIREAVLNNKNGK